MKKILLLLLILFISLNCSTPGSNSLLQPNFSLLNNLPYPFPMPKADMPGDASTCGPSEYSFYSKRLNSLAPNSLNAFIPKLASIKYACSTHFALYIGKNDTAYMSTSDASALLIELEGYYNNLINDYGVSYAPDINRSGRIVILALDTVDDFNAITNPAFVGGFFSPRDLYSDELTTAFYQRPEVINYYPSYTVTELKGHSNENQIIYMDLNPFYNGCAYDKDGNCTSGNIDASASQKGKDLFFETMLHELSHLFSYNRRVRMGELRNNVNWISEGVAEVAPLHISSSTLQINNGVGYASSDSTIIFDNLSIAKSLQLDSILIPAGSPEKMRVTSVSYNADLTSGSLNVERGVLSSIASNLSNNQNLTSISQVDNLRERMTQLNYGFIQSLLAYGAPLIEKGTLKLLNYIQTNLFFNYIRHRLGSKTNYASFLNTLITSAAYDETGLSSAIAKSFNSSQDFSTIFTDWALSNYISASAKSIATISDINGSPIADVATRLEELSYNNAGIAKKGSSGIAYQNASLPLTYLNSSFCLKPTSYIYVPYKVPLSNRQDYIPQASSMDAGLRLFMVHKDSAASLREYKLSDTIPFLTNPGNVFQTNDVVHFIIINPNTSGNCLSTGTVPVEQRNLASWIGGYRSAWQYIPGTDTANSDGYFWRQRGMAINANKNGTSYIYISDSVNHGIQRWDLQNGTFIGRIGNADIECDANGNGLLYAANSSNNSANTFNVEGFQNRGSLRFINSYCNRSFDSPSGIAVDSIGNLYIADTANHRLVKYDENGNYIAWLGYYNDDRWQCDGGDSSPPVECSTMGSTPPIRGLFMPGKGSNPKVFYSPWDVVIKEGFDNSTITLSINNLAGYSTSDTTILFDNLSSSNALQIGHIIKINTEKLRITNVSYATSFSGSLNVLRAQLNTSAFSIADNAPITLMNSYMYVSSFEGHNISRRDLVTGKFKGFIGNGYDAWNSSTFINQIKGSTLKYFDNPMGIDADNNYLYIADSVNHRIARWTLSGLQQNTSGDTSKLYLGNIVSSDWHNNLTVINPAISQPTSSDYIYRMYYPADVIVDNNFLYIADRKHHRLIRWSKNGQAITSPPSDIWSQPQWVGGGKTQWSSENIQPQNPDTFDYNFPPEFMLEPQFLNMATSSETGGTHSYIYSTSIYSARVLRWNLSCMADNIAGSCGPD